jgi:hypothetical protein
MMMASVLLAQESKPAAGSQLSPIEFLIGDWHATATRPNQPPTEIDSHIYWSENHSAVFFVTRFNGTPHYSGMYAFEPGSKQINFWYLDTDGNSTRGTARVEGKRLIQEFTNSHPDGKQEELLSYIDRSADDKSYHWQVLRVGATEPLIQLDYTRK